MVVTFEGERYECFMCSATSTDTLRAKADGWRCASCGELLQIHATDWQGTKQVLERVLVSSLEKGDLVVLTSIPFNKHMEVLDVSVRENMIHVALKRYGVIKKYSNKEVNRIVGAW